MNAHRPLWKAALDYRQGQSHRRAGIPCQDYGRLLMPDGETLIAAIADGAGSAPHSRLGARVAVEAALSEAKRRLELERFRDAGDLSKLLGEVFPAVRTALADAANDNSLALGDLACTLTVIALTPGSVAAAQIGDGFVVARSGRGSYEMLIAPDRGEHANETSFVTDPDAEARLRLAVWEKEVQFLSAATDGLATVSLDQRLGQPHTNFFRPMDQFAHMSDGAGEIHDGIREFLASDRLAARVDDDVALLVCGRAGYSV